MLDGRFKVPVIQGFFNVGEDGPELFSVLRPWIFLCGRRDAEAVKIYWYGSQTEQILCLRSGRYLQN